MSHPWVVRHRAGSRRDGERQRHGASVSRRDARRRPRDPSDRAGARCIDDGAGAAVGRSAAAAAAERRRASSRASRGTRHGVDRRRPLPLPPRQPAIRSASAATRRRVTADDAYDATIDTDYPDSVVQIVHLVTVAALGRDRAVGRPRLGLSLAVRADSASELARRAASRAHARAAAAQPPVGVARRAAPSTSCRARSRRSARRFLRGSTAYHFYSAID